MSELSSLDNGAHARPDPSRAVESGSRRGAGAGGVERERAAAGPIRRGEDRVDIDAQRLASSSAARGSGAKEQDAMVREDLVRSVRERIEAGAYLTDDKLEAAVERMLRGAERV